MNKKEDTLLQQMTENGRASTVFFLRGSAVEYPVGLKSKDTATAVSFETGSGFLVEPDKIVTTLQLLVESTDVNAIPGDLLVKTASNIRNRFFRGRKHTQDSEEKLYTIEGVTAYDTKNNLALLKIAETGIPLPIGNSDALETSETVYTLAYDDRLKCQGTTCLLQNTYRDGAWFQMKIESPPWDSGSPVLNSKNEVVGIISHGTGSTSPDDRQAIVSVISSDVVKELLANSGKVISLERMQKHPRVRAYALEAHADKIVELFEDREALRCYNAALKANPDLTRIYAKRGMVKTQLENFQGAFKDFDRMIQINPGHIFAYNNRASARNVFGDLQGAIDDLNKAIEINPDYAMAYINLAGLKNNMAKSKIEEGDIVEAKRYCQEAIDHYNKVLALNPKNRMVRKYRKDVRQVLRMLTILPEGVLPKEEL